MRSARALLRLFAISCLTILAPASGRAAVISTVAGGGPDDMPAVAANLGNPSGLAFDSSGNLYIATDIQHRILRVDRSGRLASIAGTGVRAYTGFIEAGSGNGTAADEAEIYFPRDVAVDAAGNVYFSEWGRHRIRRIEAATGIITTFAGTGIAGFSGDGRSAADARLENPSGLALDRSGNLFVADTANHRIRRIDAATGIITTFAGNGQDSDTGDNGPAVNASLSAPWDVLVDATGDLYFSDPAIHKVRRIDANTGTITTVAGTGAPGYNGDNIPGTGAQLDEPHGLAVDIAGNLLIADSRNHRVRQLSTSTGAITTVAGTGQTGMTPDGQPAAATRFNYPTALAVDALGDLYISEAGGLFGFVVGFPHRVRRVGAAGSVVSTYAGNMDQSFGGDGRPATAASLKFPKGLGAGPAGRILIADSGNHRLRSLDPATSVISTLAGTGASSSTGDGGPPAGAALNGPAGVTVDPDGNVFLSEEYGHRVRWISSLTGLIDTLAGDGTAGFSGDGGPADLARLSAPQGLAADLHGGLYIADSANLRVRRVDTATGIITTVAGGGAGADGTVATEASLSPFDVAVDNSGNLFISEPAGHRIRRVDAATGIISTLAGDGRAGYSGDGGPAAMARLSAPTWIAMDLDDNLYLVDRGNNRVRRVDGATGVITTVAGNGSIAFAGDGGPAPLASFIQPTGLGVDPAGAVHVADLWSHRVRRIGPVPGAPRADAGPDITAACLLPEGTPVTLDGSGSFDPGGLPLTYEWSGPFPEGGGLATGVAPTLTLPPGRSTIALTVSNGSATSSDAVEVTVPVQPDDFGRFLSGLVPEGGPAPVAGKKFNAGSVIPLDLRLACGGVAIDEEIAPAPWVVSLAQFDLRTGRPAGSNSADLDAGQSSGGGREFRFAGGGWVYSLTTKDLRAGIYFVTIELPDGRRFFTGFELE